MYRLRFDNLHITKKNLYMIAMEKKAFYENEK